MEALRTHILGVHRASSSKKVRGHPSKSQARSKMKFQKLTPNLVVRNVDASMDFYCKTLGFQRAITVPDQAPYVFGSVTNGAVEIFFNDQKAVANDYLALGSKPIGGALTLFVEVEGIEQILAAVRKSGAKITMALKEQFYGMREFAFEDPEGWELTIAERIQT